jgi:hypothetical protein
MYSARPLDSEAEEPRPFAARDHSAIMGAMARREDDSAKQRPPRQGASRPEEAPAANDVGGEPGGLVKCPHCGRLVVREADERPRRRTGGEKVFRCPSCGLEIKERHLA